MAKPIHGQNTTDEWTNTSQYKTKQAINLKNTKDTGVNCIALTCCFCAHIVGDNYQMISASRISRCKLCLACGTRRSAGRCYETPSIFAIGCRVTAESALSVVITVTYTFTSSSSHRICFTILANKHCDVSVDQSYQKPQLPYERKNYNRTGCQTHTETQTQEC